MYIPKAGALWKFLKVQKLCLTTKRDFIHETFNLIFINVYEVFVRQPSDKTVCKI